MNRPRNHRTVQSLGFGLALVLGVLAAGTATAQNQPRQNQPRDDRILRADRLDEAGDRLMRQGRYFQASDSYSAAVAIDPRDGLRHLAFGHALLAQGHYAYASFRLRRGIRYMGYPQTLDLDLVSLFPDQQALGRIQRDVRRYLGYYPGEHHALTVQAYLGYFGGDPGAASRACQTLLRQNPSDAYAKYIQARLALPPVPASEMAKAPPAPAPAPSAPPAAAPSREPEFSPWPPEAAEEALARTPEEPEVVAPSEPPSRYTLSRIKSLPMSKRHEPLPAVRIEKPEPAIARPAPNAAPPKGPDQDD